MRNLHLPDDTIPGYEVIINELAKTGDADRYEVLARPSLAYDDGVKNWHRNSFSISRMQLSVSLNQNDILVEMTKRAISEIKHNIDKEIKRFKYPQDILERHLRMGLNLL